MEIFSALLDICAGNSPVPGEFPAQRPVTRSFDIFFDLRLNKRLSKQSWGWWFETLSRPLWRHRNDFYENMVSILYTVCTNISFQPIWIWNHPNMTSVKRDDFSFKSFSNGIGTSLQNTHFLWELTINPNITYNKNKGNNIIHKIQTFETDKN